jgi:vacuolar-type H+-ATPase subunit I/STV1
MSTTELLSEISSLENEVDALKSFIEEVDRFLLNVDVQTAKEDREIGKLQELIKDCLSDEDEDGEFV